MSTDMLTEIQQDMTKLIGDKPTMTNNHDSKGVSVWNELHKATLLEETVDKDAISNALHEVPLYYVLSLLGYAYYRFKEDVVPMSPEKSVTRSRSTMRSPMKSPMKSPSAMKLSPMKSPSAMKLSSMKSPTSPKI